MIVTVFIYGYGTEKYEIKLRYYCNNRNKFSSGEEV